MTAMSHEVLVIGAGVCGLSAALALLQDGIGVTVHAADPPQRTTSAAAGALWGAHLVGADERVGHWARMTLGRMRELAADPAAGVREAWGMAASDVSSPDPPAFAAAADPLIRCDDSDLPAGYASGWRYRSPVVDMPRYLDYLAGLVQRAGGDLHVGQTFRRLADAAAASPARVIVNCAGVGARDLVPDPELIPVRGQVVVVANPGLADFFVGERNPGSGDLADVTYIFPHGATAVLGGTHEPGNASLQPDPGTAERILRDCAAVEPRLAGARVLAHRVGLRPVRPQVRLGARELGDGLVVVDNYGHGGAGVTLSWGCAVAVLTEVRAALG